MNKDLISIDYTHHESLTTDLISRADALKALDRLCERFEAEIADAKDNPENYTDNFIVGIEEQVAGIAHAYHEVYDIPSAEAVQGYTEWLEKLIVDSEMFEWICEDTPCPEWCEENCNYASIQAECLRHIYGERREP